MMAALADGKSEILNPLVSEDTLLTAEALRRLGVGVKWETEGARAIVVPPEKRWNQSGSPILLGNNGTGARLLPALAATGTGEFTFDGSPRLRERPVGPVIDALTVLGARVEYPGRTGFFPLKLTARGLGGGRVAVDARQSSQFLSAVLIACPCAQKQVSVEWSEPAASFPYAAMTLSMMAERGITINRTGPGSLVVPAPQAYAPGTWTVEADSSSASYFWAAALLAGGEVFTYPMSPGNTQGDSRFLEVLERMGCRIEWKEGGVRVASGGELHPIDIDMNDMPDMVPTLAVLAAFAGGVSRIRNVAHLRLKESDRLEAIATELGKLGVPNRELPDGLEISGGRVSRPSLAIDPHDDHRIAMAFAVAGLRVGGLEIEHSGVVSKSFPSFWELFEELKEP